MDSDEKIKEFIELSLYEVIRPKGDNANWDTYTGFIVCCANETDARNTHPAGHLLDSQVQKWYFEDSKKDEKAYVSRQGGWIDPKDREKLKVRRLGAACIDVEEGVIMSDFNAG